MRLPEQRLNGLITCLGWNRSDCTIVPEPMGSTNESYLCTYRDEKYVLRLGTRKAGILSINRCAEEAALKIVSKLSLGANLIYYDLETGNMVTKLLSGRELTEEDLNNPNCLNQIVQVLKTLHSQKSSYLFDFYADVEQRLDFIIKHKIPLHPEFPYAYEKYRLCKNRNRINPKRHYGLCHGDPFINNFILSDNGKLFLIDYEYSGMGDVFFDLSCIAAGLSPKMQEEFLFLYFGECTPQLMEKLNDFFIINLMWNGTWAYVKSYDVPEDVFNFVKFGDLHINHILKRTTEQ